ncbi:MAG: YqiA/YcfP family alpha/beta fold hydrolase [Ghiorsea sp.]
MLMNQKKCVYLLHGFASAPKYPSDKAEALESMFKLPVKQVAYDSAASFQDNIVKLRGQVDIDPHLFVGTSLGAFYACKLAEHFYPQFNAPVIMLNPCHNPAEMLVDVIGEHVNYATGETFKFRQQALTSYQGIPFINKALDMPRSIVLNMDDERIDSDKTVVLYQNKLNIISFEQGGHRFENIFNQEVMTALKKLA